MKQTNELKPRKVQAFGDHLGAYEKVEVSTAELVDRFFPRVLSPLQNRCRASRSGADGNSA